MRILAAATLALLAATTGADAKPPASSAQRTQATGTCIREMAQQRPSGDTPQGNPFAICDCAIDLYLAGRGPEALEAFAEGGGKGLLDRAIAECRTRNRLSLGDGATARPPASTARSAPDASPASDAGEGRSLGSWLGNLPRLWGAIGLIFGGLVLLLLLRRRGPRDLLGPPRSMRPKIKVAPRPRQDPPR